MSFSQALLAVTPNTCPDHHSELYGLYLELGVNINHMINHQSKLLDCIPLISLLALVATGSLWFGSSINVNLGQVILLLPALLAQTIPILIISIVHWISVQLFLRNGSR